LKAPFRVAVSTINGFIDNQMYFDSPKLQKVTIFNKMYESRNNYTLFPFGDFSNKNVNKESIEILNENEKEKFERDIISIINKEKKAILGSNNIIFEDLFSLNNTNTASLYKSEAYQKINNVDLIENFANSTFLDEIGNKKNYILTIANRKNEIDDMNFYKSRNNNSDVNSFIFNETNEISGINNKFFISYSV